MRFTIYSILLITAVVALLLAIKMHGIALIAILETMSKRSETVQTR